MTRRIRPSQQINPSALPNRHAEQRPARVDPTLFPFESRFVDVDGHALHYVSEGTGPTLLKKD